MGKVSLQFWITNRIKELKYFTLCSCCSPICTAYTHTPPPLLSLSLFLPYVYYHSLHCFLFWDPIRKTNVQLQVVLDSPTTPLPASLPSLDTTPYILFSPPPPSFSLSAFLCLSPCLAQFVTLIVTRFSSRLDLTSLFVQQFWERTVGEYGEGRERKRERKIEKK